MQEEYEDAKRVWTAIYSQDDEDATLYENETVYSQDATRRIGIAIVYSRSTNRSNGSTMEVYAPTDKMKRRKTF